MKELESVFARFAEKRPLPVMVRAALERSFDPMVLDAAFDCFAKKQHTRTLLFSTCVGLMAQVVTRVHRTLGSAIRANEQLLSVESDSIYEKISGLEDEVVSGALAATAAECASVIDEVDGAEPALIPGVRMMVLDGNHLRAVQHRIKPLRGLQQAALPGTCVALLDCQRQLFQEVFLLQDGHASEKLVLKSAAAALRPGDLIVTDRNLWTLGFASQVEKRQAYYLTRQNGSLTTLEFLGERTYVGETATGQVYEQAVLLPHSDKPIRRITVELFRPTRNKETVLHLLTNLPLALTSADGQTYRFDALMLSDGYRNRWKIETAFQKLTVELNCELQTLGYPPAALFGFCVAAMCYNALSVAMAALRAHFGTERVSQLSTYYMANEIRTTWEGMNLIVDRQEWRSRFADISRQEFSATLLALAARVNLHSFRKAPTRPHRPTVQGASKRAKCKHTSVVKAIKASQKKC